MADWKKRYLKLAQHVAQWSKDPSTQVAAVLVSPDNSIVSLGYNGFPKGMDDSNLEDRDYKLRHTIHAEMNCILSARTSVVGCTMYLTHPPCSTCLGLIRQAGIFHVVAISPDPSFWIRWNIQDVVRKAEELTVRLELTTI